MHLAIFMRDPLRFTVQTLRLKASQFRASSEAVLVSTSPVRVGLQGQSGGFCKGAGAPYQGYLSSWANCSNRRASFTSSGLASGLVIRNRPSSSMASPGPMLSLCKSTPEAPSCSVRQVFFKGRVLLTSTSAAASPAAGRLTKNVRHVTVQREGSSSHLTFRSPLPPPSTRAAPSSAAAAAGVSSLMAPLPESQAVVDPIPQDPEATFGLREELVPREKLVPAAQHERTEVLELPVISQSGEREEAESSPGEGPPHASDVSSPLHLPIGAFQHLPAVSPAKEILGTALRRARLVRPTKGIVNAGKRERKKGAMQIDTLTKELANPLAQYVRGFPRVSRLHPYEQAVLELTLGEGGYEEALGSVDALRKRVLDVGKSCASLINKTTSKKEAEEQTEKAFAHLEQLFSKRGHVVDALKEVAKVLRGMPVVRHDIPTLCLVGAPNVGKSSLVRAISSGKPEVCNYPFTTRGIQMGHFFVDTRRHQVTDTPGLIARPDEERNNIEMLTIAALEYLPTAVLFVHDLTGECGTSLQDQFRLYLEMKERFGDRPWIDVVSKADLLGLRDSECGPEASEDVLPEGHENLPFVIYHKCGPPGAIPASTETEQGLDVVVERVQSVLSKIQSAEDEDLDDDANESQGSGTWSAQDDTATKKKGKKEEFYYPAYPGEDSF